MNFISQILTARKLVTRISKSFLRIFFSEVRDKGILYSLIPGTQMYMQL